MFIFLKREFFEILFSFLFIRHDHSWGTRENVGNDKKTDSENRPDTENLIDSECFIFQLSTVFRKIKQYIQLPDKQNDNLQLKEQQEEQQQQYHHIHEDEENTISKDKEKISTVSSSCSIPSSTSLSTKTMIKNSITKKNEIYIKISSVRKNPSYQLVPFFFF